jgi:hypothetical protein
MNAPTRGRALTERLAQAARARGLLPAMAALPIAAVVAFPTGAARAERAAPRDQPTKIDAATDPRLAGDTYAEYCGADISKCRWQSQPPADGDVGGYGPRQIIGDALYNCSPDDEDIAETAVDISQERAETTTLSEELSVKVQGGLFKLAGASAEFKLFSSQASTISRKVTVVHGVSVPAGDVGYNTSQILGANLTGDVYITDGIKLIEITNINVAFPGYTDANEKDLATVIYPGYKAPMTQDEIDSHCNAVPGSHTGVGTTKGHGLRAPVTGRFQITVTQAGAASTTRTVIGAPPQRVAQAIATLAKTGHTVASGTDVDGDIRLGTRRALKPGAYVLRLRTPQEPVGHGRRGAYFQVIRTPIHLR